jgi:hypothetical protein
MATNDEITSCKAAILHRLAPCEVELDKQYLARWDGRQPFEHDCYRASYEFLISRGEQEDVILAHGQVQPGDTHHAWVEMNAQDVVFDATLLHFYRRSCYYQIRGAKAVRTYTYWEAIRSVTETNQYGPWLA